MVEFEVELYVKYFNLEVYEFMELEEKIVKDRMKEWWKIDRNFMIESYLILKLEIMWKKLYYFIEYNIEVFNVFVKDMNEIYNFIKMMFLICIIFLFIFFLKRWREIIFLWLIFLL